MKIRTEMLGAWKERDIVTPSSRLAVRNPVQSLWKCADVVAASSRRAVRKAAQSLWKCAELVVASSRLAVPGCVILAVATVCCFYFNENSSGGGEPFAWFEGISAWPSIAILLFAGLLSIHFVAKAHFDLRQSGAELAKRFGLDSTIPKETSFFGWEVPRSKPGIPIASADFPGLDFDTEERVDIEALWQVYLCRGRFWMRMTRATPMFGLYIMALFAILPLIGPAPTAPIRGQFNFPFLITFTICAFLFLAFFVIDAILLHEGFLVQLEEKESYWPEKTFTGFKYPVKPRRPINESDLADYWDILLISKRTEVVGRLIYYPFVILSLIIVARLSCFADWTMTPFLVVALSMHFCLALYAAWRLPTVARRYRDKVLERLRRRRRQALMLAQRTPEVLDTMIEEVQSSHQGAFAYLWEQPAIRALLLPSSGIGLATLLQYLPH